MGGSTLTTSSAKPIHGLNANCMAQDNGDGEGPYNATASWGTIEAADGFTTFMDSKTYTSKVSADENEARQHFFLHKMFLATYAYLNPFFRNGTNLLGGKILGMSVGLYFVGT